MNINHTRNLNRLANAYYDDTSAATGTATGTTTTTTTPDVVVVVPPEKRQEDLNHVALCTWAFVRSMKRHLSPEEEDEAAFCKELYEKLSSPDQANAIIAANHRPNRALQDLSNSIEALPMHYLRKNEIQQAVTIFEDNLGSSERILTSPVPLFYSRHLARFLAVWLLLMPFGIYDSFATSWNHISMIPVTVVISVMLFGIEEIGTQLEEPFTVLPMQTFCDKIYNWCMEIQTWVPGDNGRPRKAVLPQHMYFLPGMVTTESMPTTTTTNTAPPPPVADTLMNGQQHAAAVTTTTTTTPSTVPLNDEHGSGLPPSTTSNSQVLSMEEFLKRQSEGI